MSLEGPQKYLREKRENYVEDAGFCVDNLKTCFFAVDIDNHKFRQHLWLYEYYSEYLLSAIVIIFYDYLVTFFNAENSLLFVEKLQ